MKKCVFALVLSLALLAGCVPSTGEIPLSAATELTAESTMEPEPVRSEQADRAVSSLGLELLRKSREEGKNTMVSPLSAALCLSMVANGAAGETQEQFLTLLGEGCTLIDLNTNAVSLLREYGNLEGTTLEIADSIWLESGFQAERDFLLACRAFYETQVYATDFQDPKAVSAVNTWVEEHTGGMIPTLLDKFPEDTAALLLNAIYLDAKWEVPFNPDNTAPDQFRKAPGVWEETDFMHSFEDDLYFSTDTEAGVILPYKDGRLAFVAVLPEESGDLSEYLEGWDAATLDGFLNASSTQKVSLSKPKFKAEWGGDLTSILKALGLADAFEPARADFSALGVTAGGNGVYLSQVLQKTAIDVSERGVKAAAVTGAIMECGGAPAPVEYVTLTLDRPFVYAVVDLERGVPLFLGIFETP